VSLASETKSVLQQALVAQEELMSDLKAVTGSGLASELRAGLFNGLGPVSARQSSQTDPWETLHVQESIFHKQVKIQELARQVELRQRSQQELEGRCGILAGQCEYMDAQLAVVATELQSAHDALAEPQDCTSATNDLEASVVLQAAPTSSVPETQRPTTIYQPPAAASKPPGDLVTAICEETEDLPITAGSDIETMLRQELEMLNVDSEREDHMRHLAFQQAQADQQKWYQKAAAKLADLNHTQEQTMLEEQRLEELIALRRSELSKTQERDALCQLEVLNEKHELCVGAHHRALRSSAIKGDGHDKDARERSMREQVDQGVAKVRNKRDMLQRQRMAGTPWSPEVAGA
jgi:hypothetical protein